MDEEEGWCTLVLALIWIFSGLGWAAFDTPLTFGYGVWCNGYASFAWRMD